MFDTVLDFADTPSPLDGLTVGLNPPQAQAVQTTEGPLLVLAGAGTGKTNVLTRRIAYLLLTNTASPADILAVTFTNKAAKEMTNRTEQLVGHSVAGMWIGTFHSLGNRFLRQHAEAVGLKRDFVILDTDDQQRLITQMIKDLNIDSTQFPTKLVGAMISKYKDKAWTPESLPADEARALGGRARELYMEYQTRLKALNAVDFGDLLLYPLELLRTNEALRGIYQAKHRYILVDEYQDTNDVQYQWLKLLAERHTNLCVVGDDDQSIYGWRGAQVGNILNFERDFEGAQVVRLEQNYRSTGHILAAANAVIANNRKRHGKNLWTDTGHGNPIELHAHMDDREEARAIADNTQRESRLGKRYNDMAVLVRTAAQTRSLEEAFMRAGVPYTVVGGLRFYERKEVKDAIAYLRLIANPRDDLAFQRIVNVPRRGVGETTLGDVQEHARAQGEGMAAAARTMLNEGGLAGKIGGAMGQFLDQIDRWRAGLESPETLMERVLEESGYMDMLRNDKTKDKDGDAKARMDNLRELVRALGDYGDIQSFLDHVALVTDTDADTGDTVKVMTIHGAKGLEFNTVYLPGWEEGLFPNQRAINEEGQKGLEEERRLAYVAITRARQRCVMSYAHARRMWGQFLPGAPSRFLAEIPETHLKRMTSSMAPAGGGYRPQSWGRPGGFVPATPRALPAVNVDDFSQLPAHDDTVGDDDTNALRAGQKVRHAKFGSGVIKSVEGSGENARLTIDFKFAGIKKLVAGLARLERG